MPDLLQKNLDARLKKPLSVGTKQGFVSSHR